jgi:DNA-binding transcriptional LysR family regulator
MDRLEAMKILVTVTEAGSLTGAARRLGMPLPTVSRKVSDLEAHLNTRLLYRSTRKLTLTDAGRTYVDACRRILDSVGEAERAAAGEFAAPTGELVLTAPVVFGRLHVLPVVTEFLGVYPDIDVRMALSDRTLDLLDDHVDLAVRIGRLPHSNLVAIGVGSVRQVVCASPSYLAVHGEPATPAQLSAHRGVSFETLTLPDEWTFGTGRAQVAVAIRSRLVVNTAEAAVDAACAGLGITRVLSYQVSEACRSGALKVVLAAHEPPPWPVSLVHAGQGILPLKLRAFIDFAAPRLRARLASSSEGARAAASGGSAPGR